MYVGMRRSCLIEDRGGNDAVSDGQRNIQEIHLGGREGGCELDGGMESLKELNECLEISNRERGHPKAVIYVTSVKLGGWASVNL